MEASRRYRYRIGTLLLEAESPFDPLPQWAENQEDGPPQLWLRVRFGQAPPAPAEAQRIGTSIGPVWRSGNCFRMEHFLLEASPDFTRFEALVFGPDTSHLVAIACVLGGRRQLLIHSSCVVADGQGYAFLAPSGTGKSTHADNWVRAFPGCQLLNDDNPILSLAHQQVLLHGSPWSGKRNVYLQRSVPLRALVRIVRGEANHIERATPLDALTMILEATSTLRRDPQVYLPTLNTIKQVLHRVPCFILHCLPDEASARLCRSAIERER